MTKTNITIHINTGEKKENGNNKQMHAILWNSERDQDQFFGGVAEVQEGKLAIVTAPVEVEGKTYQNPAQQLALFVNRNKRGRVMALSLTRDGKKVGEIKFKKTINGKELLTGTYNEAGLQFDEEFRVVAGVEGNRAIFAEVKGGLREEIVASMIGKKAATASNDDQSQAAA